jgi:hypothetical protein
VYEDGISVCAPLEMPDRYHFHSLRRPRLKFSGANELRAGGPTKRLSRNLFHSNAPRFSIQLRPTEHRRSESLGSIDFEQVLF